MYWLAIAWIYVALMMAAAEATNSNGTVAGAVFTFLGYGVLPLALVLYIGRAPARRRARRAREAAKVEPASAAQPDGGGHAPGDAVAPVREEP